MIKRVYVAGKLNDNAVGYLKNVSRMMAYAEKVRSKGFAVLVPCQDLLMGIKFGDYNYQDYFLNNLEWLRVSDALVVVPGWESSKGTRAEIAEAEKLGIPVFYTLRDLVEASQLERGGETLSTMNT